MEVEAAGQVVEVVVADIITTEVMVMEIAMVIIALLLELMRRVGSQEESSASSSVAFSQSFSARMEHAKVVVKTKGKGHTIKTRWETGMALEMTNLMKAHGRAISVRKYINNTNRTSRCKSIIQMNLCNQ